VKRAKVEAAIIFQNAAAAAIDFFLSLCRLAIKWLNNQYWLSIFCEKSSLQNLAMGWNDFTQGFTALKQNPKRLLFCI